MPSVFEPKRGTWQIDWPGRVARHDLVFLSPPEDPVQGLPIGNGEIGVLCWFESSKVIFAVNKSDLWDDAKFGRFINWNPKQEEFSTTLRHGCRIILDFKQPIFDLFYLKDFQARINLPEAAIEFSASGPFGSVRFKGFVDHATGVFSSQVESNLKENLPLEIKVQRYGSRTFSHWYSRVNCNPQLGLKGTKALADKDGVYITHKLTTGTFAAGGRIVETNRLKTVYAIEDSHTGVATLTGANHKKFTFLAAVTSPLAGKPVAEVKRQLEAARKLGTAAMFAAHKKAWKEFWLRSLMEFGDDYLDSLWHLTMFYDACSQRGKYPGRFINGLWTWNRDVQNWNFYFHWNQQQVYWPLNAAGHHDLVESYLNYRFNSLDHAKEDAKTAFKSDGAIVSDVCERRGYNSEGEFHNHTPAAQIAMEFWRQYKFTGDREFLKTKALPFIREAAYFFESLFEKDKDGKYHAKEGTGYEGWILLHDCVSELVYGKVLFTTALEALKEAGEEDPRAGRWKEILDHLAPLPTVKADKGFIGKGKFQRGWFKGDAAVSDKLLAAGFGVKEKKWLTSFLPQTAAGPASEALFEMINMNEGKPAMPDPYRDDIRCNDGIFPWVENAAVFPSGLVGLSQKGTDLFKTTANTVKMFACPGMGWFPLGITLARLGLGKEARKVINSWPMLWQYFSNGWGHYGPLAIMKAESSVPFRVSLMGMQDTSLPEDEREKHPISARMFPFRHMGMEAMSVFAGAINESLLQSHDGIIRVAPAVTADQNARFTLHAQDGFVVSSEIEKGKPRWIGIESKLGKTCKLANPWPKAVVYENGKKMNCLTEKIVEFLAVAGKHYMIAPDERIMKNWKTTPVRYPRNEKSKTHSSGYTSLGLPRLF
jgi:alpha-L-fucosidase 2